MPGWLVDQLPRALAHDRFTRRFVSIFESMGDEVRSQIDALEYYADVDSAPPGFVRWLGSWIGLDVESTLPEERQRAIVRVAGQQFGSRGTASGLTALLEAVTGAEVRVVDGGGVWRTGEAPPNPGRILVRLSDTGGLDERHLLRLIQSELPIGITFELRVADRTVSLEAMAPAAPLALDEIAPPEPQS
ncbi:MAG: tail protein [Chloroflexota bacterium]